MGEAVALEEQAGFSGGWHTLALGILDAASNYSISANFREPGAFDLRAVLPGDARDIQGSSDLISVTIEQTQNSSFTINTSAPVVRAGQEVTISGILYKPDSVVPLPAATVTPWGHIAGGTYAPITTTTTGSDGSYVFTQTLSTRVVYQARATSGAPPTTRMSAQVFEGLLQPSGLKEAPLPGPPTTTTTTTTAAAPATVVTVTTGAPKTYGFTLSALGQTVYSYQTKQLSVPAGVVTFKVTNALGIDNHNLYICSTPLSASAAKTAAIELPQTCTGTGTASLAPGDSATLTADFTTAGTYEYLSNVGCPTFCDSGDGMIGKLQVT